MKLVEQLQAEAAKFGIIVNEVDGGFELEAPAGMQFSEELHFLVNSQWDNEPMPNVIRSAIRDVKENGPRLQKCPDDCPCKQAAENDETDLRICDCGATAEVLHGWHNADYVACTECGAQTDEYELHSGDAERAWNKKELLGNIPLQCPLERAN